MLLDSYVLASCCRAEYTEKMRVAWALQGLGFMLIIGVLLMWIAQENRVADPRTPPNTESMKTGMIVRSPAFNHEEAIPSKYTCDGEDVSPPLAIDNIPDGSVSLVIIVDDPDAPGTTWDHWIVYNVPASVTRIGEGENPPGTLGANSWGSQAYGGPCPPSGSHRYLFKIYALDIMLDVPAGASKAAVMADMEGHVLESATLMGHYARI